MLKNNYLLFLLLVVCYFVFTYAYENVLATDDFVFKSLSGEYSAEVISQYIYYQHKWNWLSYSLIPLVVFVRTTFIAFLIQMAAYFVEDKDYPFKDFWRVALNAEWVMVFIAIVKFF